MTGSYKPLRSAPSPATLWRIVRALSRLARSSGRRMALAGGLAMQAYGSPRQTTDVDVLSKEVPAQLLARRRALRRLAFGGVSVQVSGVTVDVIVRSDREADLYEEALATAGGGRGGLPIVRPEYLVAMKVAAGRGKDTDDVLFLLGERLADPTACRKLVARFFGKRSTEAEDLGAYIFEAEHGGNVRRDRIRARWRARRS